MATPIVTDTNKGAFPDTQRFAADDVLADALVNTITSVGPVVEGDNPAVRIPYVSEDVDAAFIDEGAEFTDEAPTLSELVVQTKKVGVLSVVSNEAYNAAGVAGLLTNSLRRSIINKADAVLLTNPVATPQVGPVGLINTTGLVEGTGITPATGIGPVIDLLAQIDANGGTPTAFVASPTAWASLQKLSLNDGQLILGNAADGAARQLLGLPVIVNRHLTAGTVLAVDESAILSAVGPVEASTSSERYFELDSIGLRVSFRFGFGVLHPDRLGKFTATDGE